MSKTEEKQVTLQDYLRILISRKWLISLCFLCFAGSATAFSFLISPVYQGRTTILIEKEGKMEDQIFTISSMMQSETKIKNQVEIIKSRTLAQAVVEAVLDSPHRKTFKNMVDTKHKAYPSKDQMIKVRFFSFDFKFFS